MTVLSWRTRWRLLSSCLAVALLAAGPCDAAGDQTSSESIKVHYRVSLIGLPLGSALVSGWVDPGGYHVEASAKLSGLASLMSSSHGAASASGALNASHVAPATYATTSANSQMTRTLRMAMTAGTVTGVEIVPPFDPSVERVPVTEADKRNILDPLSAFVMTVPSGDLVGPAACNRVLPVFDGATRFDVTLAYVGTRHVKAKGYDGDASVCSARYKPISGHRADRRATQFMADNKDMEVWLVPIAGTHAVFPFRISVATMVGTTVIEADEFSATPMNRAAVMSR